MLGLRVLSVYVLVAICSRVSYGELFTALTDLEPLLETHKRIIDDLDTYVMLEEKRIQLLKGRLSYYKAEHEKAMEDIPNYLGNPINAFTLIKRLTTDLEFIEKGINLGTEYTRNYSRSHEGVKYPTEEDLTGAARALERLKDTYRLNVTDLSEGVLQGVEYSTPMRWSDCFAAGRALYLEGDYRGSLPWLLEALRKFSIDVDPMSHTEVDIIEYIAYAHYLIDEVHSAVEWTKRLLKIQPQHERALGNIPHYYRRIAELEATEVNQLKGDTGAVPVETSRPSEYSLERRRYEALCRGDVTVAVDVSSRLRCRYLTENHPFLRLAPFKVEQVYVSPDVYVYHDVLSDAEIRQIKEMAKPRFKRAVVHDPVTGELSIAQYRISKSGWLKDEEHPLVARVSRRVEHMSALSTGSAEELQVVNYGIGGHYEPHYDFARKRESAFTKYPGNRIATVLFYMSDVALGGATVFTELGVRVPPVKGAALYWTNLHPSGEGDLATRHAACPVLRGSKWVCNKWIHQGGQELIKPCNLEYQPEGIIRKIPKPVPKTAW